MIEETSVYLNISKKKYEIYLYDIKNLKIIYKNDIELKNHSQSIDLNILSKFLEENIFKIEKLTSKFIKNIFLIITTDNILNVEIGIKKKSYEGIINKKIIENAIAEIKDLFRENYQDYKIMHILINKFTVNDQIQSEFINNLEGDKLCLEIKFLSIPNSYVIEFDKILAKYQIKIIRYFDQTYIMNLFQENKIEIPFMIEKVISGFNKYEVNLVKKTYKKLGFFEKFFQLFN